MALEQIIHSNYLCSSVSPGQCPDLSRWWVHLTTLRSLIAFLS